MNKGLNRSDMQKFFRKGGSRKGNQPDSPKGLKIDDMIGLDNFKDAYSTLVKRICVEKELLERGIINSAKIKAMNFMFQGNPGTAKTTVAKMLGEDFKSRGILSKGHTVLAGRRDIIGQYMGETSNRVRRAFKKAEGGVLLIDEAYSLIETNGDKVSGYGKEAIDTMVEELGIPNSDRVVIFAGYPDLMEEFMDTNPGLKSRVTNKLTFDDYSEEELYQILKLHAKNDNVIIAKGVKRYLMSKFSEIVTIDGYGNGRFAVNLLDKAVSNQRVRIYDNGIDSFEEKELKTLRKVDFEVIEGMISELQTMGKSEKNKAGHKAIGFNLEGYTEDCCKKEHFVAARKVSGR